LIKSEIKERVARIRFDRPEKKNAITVAMYPMLGTALTAAEADPQVRAVLLHGTAECFTAGNDDADFLKRSPGGEGSPTWRLFEVLPALQKPIGAAVGGPAVGIGSTLLLHCDLVYAASNARFQLPFVPLGIVPEFGSTFLLPLLAGYQRAAELLLLGQPFDAHKAYDAGFVSAVVSQEDLLDEAGKAAAFLASLPAESIRLTKRLMKARYGKTVAETIAEEGRIFRERLQSPEAKQALNAFLDKTARKPGR
jgi:enoyl-CoA hydratase/carnithine racemase